MHHIFTEEELLRRLKLPASMTSFAALRHFQNLVAARRKELILEARRLGWSWYDLGIVLRVSPQAVHQQWKRYVEAEDGDDD